MSTLHHPTAGRPLHSLFLQPLFAGLARSDQQRSCPSLPDDLWLEAGVRRGLGGDFSGRAFLERLADESDCDIPVSNFFEALKSRRRLALVRSVNEAVVRDLSAQAHGGGGRYDPFAEVASLANFDLYAGDGHYVEKACHDTAIDGKHFASGQFFGLNLRTHALFQMTHADRKGRRKREHDMHALKRLTADDLRRGAAKGAHGRKVLWVWDRAGIDAAWWVSIKMQHGIYFLSRSKENMALETRGLIPYEANDPVNAGVTGNRFVYVANTCVRCVDYTCPASGESYHFITTLSDPNVAPGVIAMLYKARWDIEKVFDETKRKLQSVKAWATTQTAKNIQACFLALTHNMLLLLERTLEVQHNLEQVTEIKRREKRLSEHRANAAQRQMILSPLWEQLFLRPTQRMRIFIRWVRNNLPSNRAITELIRPLNRRYGSCLAG